jgi:hypothetical protein
MYVSTRISQNVKIIGGPDGISPGLTSHRLRLAHSVRVSVFLGGCDDLTRFNQVLL